MKLGIMQPYFAPYIGYWQLMNAVDQYVVYDDVNFIKGGWINRNRILVNGEAKYFNIQMQGASPNKLINEIEVSDNIAVISKNLRVLEAAYKKAPYFNDTYQLLESILTCKETNLARFIKYSFDTMCDYMSITTKLIVSSTVDKDNELKAQDKVLSIGGILGATEYYNAIGGQELYSFQEFKNHGIKLSFLQTESIEYRQFDNEFVPNLSIIDVMMFNSKDKIQEYLNAYKLITE